MLLTPRTYSLAQAPDQGRKKPVPYLIYGSTVKEEERALKKAREMLLLHQSGSVKVGEVIRYTLTYTPSADRILPTPPHLHVKIKNTEAIPLRAAYLHGPYTLHVATYPSTYNPNSKVENPKRDGIPAFEPNVKAGGSWNARLTIPEEMRETGSVAAPRNEDGQPQKVTWIIEIASQIMFSKTADVGFEVLVSRDEKSLEMGFTSVTGGGKPQPGQLHDHQQGKHKSEHHSRKGVYSKAVELDVDDITSLWNKPPLPEWSVEDMNVEKKDVPLEQKQKKVHLVILTHGLHSNLGADMLYLKESIDATVKDARLAARERKKAARKESKSSETSTRGRDRGSSRDEETGPSIAPLSGGQEDLQPTDDPDDEDDEEVVVRGFPGNAVRTEKGIQYLGKRLAKHVLRITYPDQPFMPVKKTFASKMSQSFSPTKQKPDELVPVHEHSTIGHPSEKPRPRAYRYTHISFIGHSLGGLVQMYAIAYIQKHSPEFFDMIEPINFVALASPFLGLSNENPVYVKFALDFGLVGKTGQDLGLTWTAPTLAKSGWASMVSGFGANNQKDAKTPDPGSKPVLRILPTGPAHQVLRRFRNRTVYSNVVNDGIVPLRTGCLLFLDWRGLGRVDKARRENGLIGTLAEFGYAQLSGQNSSPNPSRPNLERVESSSRNNSRTDSPSYNGEGTTVPQPGQDVTNEDDTLQTEQTTKSAEPATERYLGESQEDSDSQAQQHSKPKSDSMLVNGANSISSFLKFLRPSGAHTAKDTKMFKRSQTIMSDDAASSSTDQTSEDNSSTKRPASKGSEAAKAKNSKRPKATRGDSLLNDPSNKSAPPKTTIFESAGDLINPPLPPTSWIIDPASRTRTIFHDRVYHPEDIPPPPVKRRGSKMSQSWGSVDSNTSETTDQSNEDGGMRIEEKIARAYHKDLSWRKVLVRLEPDAHNNIIVRRMFANAYGWPVVKHLCDTHFGDNWSARTRDENEPAVDRAPPMSKDVGGDGEEVAGQQEPRAPVRSNSEMREASDELKPLREAAEAESPTKKKKILRQRSDSWDDSYFDDSDNDETDSEVDDRNPIARFLNPSPQPPKNRAKAGESSKSAGDETAEGERPGTSPEEIAAFLTASPTVESHRGLAPTVSHDQAKPGANKATSPTSPTYAAEAPGTVPTTASSEPSKISSSRDADSLLSLLPGQSSAQDPPPEQDSERPKTSGSTSGVGLGKSIEEKMGSPVLSGKETSDSVGGVGEHVAKLSTEGKK